ncbi:hypothetical protein Q1695_014986 [Nippostrongylus brasiliensis]|nr:hypothetical protein Q1695_014986 [Nippostrongylus brasiliensis]
MSAEDLSLDDLLFAKFAELDQKVAMLREEMDSIAALLERRKRIRDTSISIATRFVQNLDCLPHCAHLEAWQVGAPQPYGIVESSPPTLSFEYEADRVLSGRLQDADLPIERLQRVVHQDDHFNDSSRAVFHPYRRPRTTQDVSLRSQTTKRTSLPACFMSGFHPAADEAVALEQDSGAEDPPSDPDDNEGPCDD